MHTKLRRAICSLLSALMIFTVLTSCSSQSENTAPAEGGSETVTDSEIGGDVASCADADEGHSFGVWESEYFISDVIVRRCTECGRSEHASGWVPTEQLPECGLSEETLALAEKMPTATYDNLPQWNGVSLHSVGDANNLTRVTGFQTRRETVEKMAAYGFNYSRVTLDMNHFFRDASMREANSKAFIELDSIIAMCVENNIHCSLNGNTDFGRSYSDFREDTTFKDEAMQDAFVRFWEIIAERYKNVSSNALDFDLMNEPREYNSVMQYVDLMNRTVDAIRTISPDRLIVVEMADWSYTPLPQFAGKNVVEAFHYYIPDSPENADEWWTPESVYANIKQYVDFSEQYGIKVILNECGAIYEKPAKEVAAWFDATFAACRELGVSWNVHDYFGYYGFATADKYCIRSDTPYAITFDEGKPVYVYPDILESFQKNMDPDHITLTADDIRGQMDNDALMYNLRVEPGIVSSVGGKFFPEEKEGVVVSDGILGFEHMISWDCPEVPDDAEIVRFDITVTLSKHRSGLMASVRPSFQITDVRVITENGDAIAVGGFVGHYDKYGNGEKLSVEIENGLGLTGEEWRGSRIMISLRLDDIERITI